MTSDPSSLKLKYQFVSDPGEDLKCLICLEVAEEPWQHGKCGRLFCKKCLEQYGEKRPCPNCRARCPQYLQDGRSKREIKALKVKCDNSERECEWVGTVGTIQKHVSVCKFALLPCIKECKDEQDQVRHFLRKDLQKHLKQDCPNRCSKCVLCGQRGTYVEITEVHDEVCPKKIVPCPNSECTDTMQRQQVEEHVATECEHSRTPCKYRRLGCETELKRKDMAAHEEDDKYHFQMAVDTTLELEDKNMKLLNDFKQEELKVKELGNRTSTLEIQLKEAQDRIAELEEDLYFLQDEKMRFEDRIKGKFFTFKVSNYQKAKNNNEAVYSPYHYITPQGYYMTLRVDTNGYHTAKGTHITVYVYIAEGKHDKQLKWPLCGKVTFTLLNQLEDENHQVDVKLVNVPVKSFQGSTKFIPHSKLNYDPVKNTQYLKDNTLYFKVSVEVADSNFNWSETCNVFVEVTQHNNEICLSIDNS